MVEGFRLGGREHFCLVASRTSGSVVTMPRCLLSSIYMSSGTLRRDIYNERKRSVLSKKRLSVVCGICRRRRSLRRPLASPPHIRVSACHTSHTESPPGTEEDECTLRYLLLAPGCHVDPVSHWHSLSNSDPVTPTH